jgi:hypothetical protein
MSYQDWQPGDPLYLHRGCFSQYMFVFKNDECGDHAASWNPDLGWYGED